MLADCDRCALRDLACGDCVISVLPGGQAGLGEAERQALRALAAAGLVPPLRFSAGPGPAGPRRQAGPAADLRIHDTSPIVPSRHGIEGVKTGPRVAEPVETALALH